jgi:hypothetical protein
MERTIAWRGPQRGCPPQRAPLRVGDPGFAARPAYAPAGPGTPARPSPADPSLHPNAHRCALGTPALGAAPRRCRAGRSDCQRACGAENFAAFPRPLCSPSKRRRPRDRFILEARCLSTSTNARNAARRLNACGRCGTRKTIRRNARNAAAATPRGLSFRAWRWGGVRAPAPGRGTVLRAGADGCAKGRSALSLFLQRAGFVPTVPSTEARLPSARFAVPAAGRKRDRLCRSALSRRQPQRRPAGAAGRTGRMGWGTASPSLRGSEAP